MNARAFAILAMGAFLLVTIGSPAEAHGYRRRAVRPLPPPVEMTIPEQSYYCVEVHCQGPPPVLPYPGLQIRPVPLPAAPPPPLARRPAPMPAPMEAPGGQCVILQSRNGNGFYDLVLDQSKMLYQGYGPNVEAMLEYYRSTGVCRR